MNNSAELMIIVEGQTELIFMRNLLIPHLATCGVYACSPIISKPNSKGGDVKFSRVRNEIGNYLKQRNNTFVTIFFDFYGIKKTKDWPGYLEAKAQCSPRMRAEQVNQATQAEIVREFAAFNAENRFIPYFAMHEFEALLFSSPSKLAQAIVAKNKEQKFNFAHHCEKQRNMIEQLLKENDNKAEAINTDKPPSKYLDEWVIDYKKTVTGIDFATQIGLPIMREGCSLFNEWLTKLENLTPLMEK